MTDLRYEAPSTLDAAVALLTSTKGTVRLLAGGTDVIVQMQTDVIEPELLVDIKKIPELRRIVAEAGTFRVGSAVTCMELIEHAGFASAWPGVVDAVKLIGSIQVKGRATLAGNLCNASPAADSVPALIAAGARVTIVGPKGARELPVEKIPTGPGTTSLMRGEIVTSFVFPQRAPRSGGAYQRFTPRTEMDIAVVGVGINLVLDARGVCTAAPTTAMSISVRGVKRR
jgi:CO/xanthine dehydrogenase FAD-binding subunit